MFKKIFTQFRNWTDFSFGAFSWQKFNSDFFCDKCLVTLKRTEWTHSSIWVWSVGKQCILNKFLILIIFNKQCFCLFIFIFYIYLWWAWRQVLNGHLYGYSGFSLSICAWWPKAEKNELDCWSTLMMFQCNFLMESFQSVAENKVSELILYLNASVNTDYHTLEKPDDLDGLIPGVLPPQIWGLPSGGCWSLREVHAWLCCASICFCVWKEMN